MTDHELRVAKVFEEAKGALSDQGILSKSATVALLLRAGAENTVAMQAALERRDEVIRSLEQRVAAMETHGVKYAGTYQRAQSYRQGHVVTDQGGMWIALRHVAEGEQPGKVLDAWQLAEKVRKRVPSESATR